MDYQKSDIKIITFKDGGQCVVSNAGGATIRVTADNNPVINEQFGQANAAQLEYISNKLATHNLNFDTINGDMTITPIINTLTTDTEAVK